MPIDDYSPQTGQRLRDDNTKWNQADHWSVLRSPFQEQKTVELTNILELKSIYGVTYRDVTSSTGSGSVGHNGSEFKLQTSASTGDRAELSSAEIGRYVPGYGAEAGIAVRTPSTTLPSTGQEERWGLFDDDDGFYYGRSSTGMFLALRRGGSDRRIGRSEWNGDRLDGTGPSGLALDPSRGNIYQVDFSWYGYGPVEFKAMVPSTDNRQVPVTLHREVPVGETSVANPNLPIRAELTRGGGSSHSLFVAGRKYAVVGRYSPNRRRTAERRIGRTGVSTGDFVPLISFRRKASVTDGAQFESASAKASEFEVIADNDMVWQLRTGATLSSSTTFDTPSEYSAAETSLESERQSTGLSGGDVLDSGLISGGQKNSRSFTEENPLDFDFIGRDPVTLCVRATTGTGTVNSCIFTAREEF